MRTSPAGLSLGPSPLSARHAVVDREKKQGEMFGAIAIMPNTDYFSNRSSTEKPRTLAVLPLLASVIQTIRWQKFSKQRRPVVAASEVA